MRLLANQNNKRINMVDFTWSYSSLKQYQNCPKQYQEIRVLKNNSEIFNNDDKLFPRNH